MDQPVADADVIDRLNAAAKDGPETRIYLRASKTVPYGRVAEIMGEVTTAGYKKVALVTDPQGSEGPGLDEETQRAGLIVSGAMHLALLAVLVFGFSHAPRFDDASGIDSRRDDHLDAAQRDHAGREDRQARAGAAPPSPPRAPRRSRRPASRRRRSRRSGRSRRNAAPPKPEPPKPPPRQPSRRRPSRPSARSRRPSPRPRTRRARR